jgi:hypothetical protein
MGIFKTTTKYKLVVELNEQISYYTCKVIYEDDLFIKVIDKKNEEITFNKNIIKSFREVLDG